MKPEKISMTPAARKTRLTRRLFFGSKTKEAWAGLFRVTSRSL